MLTVHTIERDGRFTWRCEPFGECLRTFKTRHGAEQAFKRFLKAAAAGYEFKWYEGWGQ